MREIEFRGKVMSGSVIDPDAPWVYGYLYEEEPPPQCFGPGDPSIWHILRSGMSDWDLPRPTQVIRANPDTISQYAFHKDKKDKKIYEGDIVRVTNRAGKNGIMVVYWNELEFNFSLCYVRFYMQNGRDALYPSLYLTGSISCLVLGNIWDNPDLLEDYKNKRG